MLAAVLSDIHANRQAFEAVLADARALGVDEIWCLGDVVGYGGEPEACVALAVEHCDLLLGGNHDLAAVGRLSIADFSPRARLSAQWTAGALSPAASAALAPLDSLAERESVGLYHGSPRHPVWEYVITAGLADLCLDSASQRVCIVGHSHVAGAFSRRDGEPAAAAAIPGGEPVDIAGGEWLLNPGSVGQPRDGDPRAAWMTLDTGAWTATWRRTAYDVTAAQAAIRAADLPESLADRLQYGQ
jgi:predicted phosphodiesterase